MIDYLELSIQKCIKLKDDLKNNLISEIDFELPDHSIINDNLLTILFGDIERICEIAVDTSNKITSALSDYLDLVVKRLAMLIANSIKPIALIEEVRFISELLAVKMGQYKQYIDVSHRFYEDTKELEGFVSGLKYAIKIIDLLNIKNTNE